MVPHTPNRPETNVMGLDPGAPKEMKETAADRLEKRLVEMKAKARDRATNAKKGLMAVLNTPFHFVIFRIDKVGHFLAERLRYMQTLSPQFLGPHSSPNVPSSLYCFKT